ncbi:NUDIX hydrolase [Urechidicola croceus]|uniref:Nudix hydrolase domain-containing protein n=1 Tax=Urechidicola croceus TaxID=1850246 RepID=A0A1D8P3Y8_9FLAO|nr:NUDIX domain-containing protein [Urechidicola croceus]AOW19278.1 hypothetical protein LPB138_00610 [Urechidicola croceus]
MNDEYIDILNKGLTVKKTCLKSEAHLNGWFHASVHVWLFTTDGKILIQKRSPNKIAFPNLWDVSVAGHISSGENDLTSAIREVEEEIGYIVSGEDLTKIGTFKEIFHHNEHFIDNEIHHIYIGILKTTLESLKIQTEELTAIKLIDIKDLQKLRLTIEFEKIYTPHYPEYYDFVLKKIQEQLTNL